MVTIGQVLTSPEYLQYPPDAHAIIEAVEQSKLAYTPCTAPNTAHEYEYEYEHKHEHEHEHEHEYEKQTATATACATAIAIAIASNPVKKRKLRSGLRSGHEHGHEHEHERGHEHEQEQYKCLVPKAPTVFDSSITSIATITYILTWIRVTNLPLRVPIEVLV